MALRKHGVLAISLTCLALSGAAKAKELATQPYSKPVNQAKTPLKEAPKRLVNNEAKVVKKALAPAQKKSTTTARPPSTPVLAKSPSKAPKRSAAAQVKPVMQHQREVVPVAAPESTQKPKQTSIQSAETAEAVLAPTVVQSAPAANLVATPTLAANANAISAAEPIYIINQRFARVPTEFCPVLSNGYGFELNYAAADAATYPTVSKVYGRAYLAGLSAGAQLLAVNGQEVRTQAQFNTIAYQGRARQAANLIAQMQLTVLQNGKTRTLNISKGDYCLSNLSAESERNILRMDFNTKGTGYSAKADARVYVDSAFLNQLNENDWLTLSAVAAGEQYRQGVRVKRGKTGLFIGQVFGTIVTLFTGIPVTDLTASSANALGMKDRNEGALRPALSYAYYLGVEPADMRVSLEKLASYREGYKVQGKRYDWPMPDDLSELTVAQQELNARIAAREKNLMLEPKTPAGKKTTAIAKSEETAIVAPASESAAGVGSY